MFRRLKRQSVLLAIASGASAGHLIVIKWSIFFEISNRLVLKQDIE
jgi:hypothetical protein